MTDIALDGASRSSAMLLQLLLPASAACTPGSHEVPHDEVLGAAAGTTRRAGDRRRRFRRGGPLSPRRRSGRRLARADRAAVRLRGLGRAPGRGRPRGLALRASLAPASTHRAEIARGWAEAHGGDPADYERYLTDNIRYRLGAEELSGVAAFFDRGQPPPA